MMKRIFLSIFILIFSISLYSQITIWTIGTARTVPKGSAEFGILHPLQVGVSETMEISTQPLLTLGLAPNLQVKKLWWVGNIMVATQHRYNMPTLLIRAMGDIDQRFTYIPDTSRIPYLFGIGNDILVTANLGPETIFTWKLGGDFGLKTGENTMPEIYQPFLYPRTAIYFNKFVWNFGMDIDGNIYKKFNYSADMDFYSIGLKIDDWALEHKGYFIYNHSVNFAAMAGYKISYGRYPEGRRFYIAPVIDLIFKINAPPPKPVPGLWRKS
jgi:hypothetical protein